MIQMLTTSRIQETKMQYDTNVYHLQNIGDKDAITNVSHLQDIGDKDAITNIYHLQNIGDQDPI